MSEISPIEKSYTEKELEILKELCGKATQVVGWYAHYKQVRGPFCRWFEITEVADQYKQHVGTIRDDLNYCAAAMNELPRLIAEIERLKKQLQTFWRADVSG